MLSWRFNFNLDAVQIKSSRIQPQYLYIKQSVRLYD